MTADREPKVGETRADPLSVPRDADTLGVLDGSLEDEPWRTPYAPGAVRIPEPVLPPAPPRRGPVDWLLIAGPLAAALVGVAAVTVAYGGAWGLRGTVVTAGYFAGLLNLLARVRREDRGSESRAAGSALLAIATLLSPILVVWYGPASTVLGLLAFGAGAMAWRSVSRIRAADRRAGADRANRTAAHHLAVEWNHIREALRAPGAHVERSLGSPSLDEPLRVRTVSPETGVKTVRNLDVPLLRDAWVVVDDSGSAICTAAPGALEAWLATWPESRARS